jgi:hypothetical protein
MIWRLSPGSVTEHEPSSLILAASNRSFLSKATHTPEVLTVRSPARRACKARQDPGRISTLHSSWLCTLPRPVTGSVTSRFVAFGLEFVCIFIVQGETRETSNADRDHLQHADETIRGEFFSIHEDLRHLSRIDAQFFHPRDQSRPFQTEARRGTVRTANKSVGFFQDSHNPILFIGVASMGTNRTRAVAC